MQSGCRMVNIIVVGFTQPSLPSHLSLWCQVTHCVKAKELDQTTSMGDCSYLAFTGDKVS